MDLVAPPQLIGDLDLADQSDIRLVRIHRVRCELDHGLRRLPSQPLHRLVEPHSREVLHLSSKCEVGEGR